MRSIQTKRCRMGTRLEELIERGHGDCFEAIMLEEDMRVRAAKLRDYVARVPDSTKIGRKARKILKNMEKS